MEQTPQETPEHKAEKIIRGNVHTIDMQLRSLLSSESIGGNAGRVVIDGTRFNCGGANGFLNPATGEILIFENIQNVPLEIRKRGTEFTFRVAVDRKLNPFRIVSVYYDVETLPSVREIIDRTIAQWNQKQPPPDLIGFK